MTEKELIERVAYAIDVRLSDLGFNPSDFLVASDLSSMATAAIDAYNAYLWQRSRDDDVVEAVRGRMLLWPLAEEDCNAIATDGITAALDAMIGKEQDDER